ncbi:MAG: single-stranded DNA-binding protein [Desertimonas sp.]
MAIRTQQSLSGFIAAAPQLSFTERGDARLYVKVGQEHYRRNDDETFTKLETTFHDLVQFKRAAERSYAQFRKGDHFVAEGYVREYSYEANGQTIEGEEFVAKKIGHDTARTTYTVDRDRPTRAAERGQGIDAPTSDAATPSRDREQVARQDRAVAL